MIDEEIVDNYIRVHRIKLDDIQPEPEIKSRPWKTLNHNYEEVDTESKNWFKSFLESRGQEVLISPEKYSPFDLVSTNRDQKIYWELKTIDCKSTKWPDVKIDAKKVDTLKSFGIPAYIVLFFEDRWTSVNVFDIDTKLERNRCNTTTAWKGSKILKNQYSIKHRDLEYLNY